jgi:hypothetical protein
VNMMVKRFLFSKFIDKKFTNYSSTDRNVEIVSVEHHDQHSNFDSFTLCM